ncbi:MAG: hypothetical protein Q9227_005148 [Pyrenula ochraceoflavens]
MSNNNPADLPPHLRSYPVGHSQQYQQPPSQTHHHALSQSHPHPPPQSGLHALGPSHPYPNAQAHIDQNQRDFQHIAQSALDFLGTNDPNEFQSRNQYPHGASGNIYSGHFDQPQYPPWAANAMADYQTSAHSSSPLEDDMNRLEEELNIPTLSPYFAPARPYLPPNPQNHPSFTPGQMNAPSPFPNTIINSPHNIYYTQQPAEDKEAAKRQRRRDRERGVRYRCYVHGCGKLLTRKGGVKSHIDRLHPGVEWDGGKWVERVEGCFEKGEEGAE